MALISCPECGKQISEYAENCIGCGCPMDIIQEILYAQVEDFGEPSKYLRLIEFIDYSDVGADIFASKGQFIEMDFPNITPSLLVACYVFNHSTDFDMEDAKSSYIQAKIGEGEYNAYLEQVFNSSLSNEEKQIAILLFGLKGKPVSRADICATHNKNRPFSTHLLIDEILHKLNSGRFYKLNIYETY